MRRPRGLSFGELRRGLQDLGLGQAPIVVAHVSLRSFGRVDGGARTVIAALRSVVPTVVMPTFTYETMLPAPPHAILPNNAAREAATWDDFHHALASTDPYRPNLPPSKAMGAVALALLGEPDAQRSSSPLLSFGGVGPQAADLLSHGTPDHHLGVLEAAAHAGAHVALLGVGHTANTTIHVAEHLEFRGRFTRWARVQGDQPGWMAVSCGGDSDGFAAIEPHIRPWQRDAMVGSAYCRAVPARIVIQVARDLIRRNPAALLPSSREPGSRSEAALRQYLSSR